MLAVRKQFLQKVRRSALALLTTDSNQMLLWEVHLSVCMASVVALSHAKTVFEKMPMRNVVSWNAIISVSIQNGHVHEALQLYSQMQPEAIQPNKVTFICILNACTCQEVLSEGQKIHRTIAESACDIDVALGAALVNMYGKCGSADNARTVFDKIPQRDVVLWSAMIMAYAQSGYGKEALDLFVQMQVEGTMPDKIAFICALGACASLEALTEGQDIHAVILANKLESDITVGNALVNMYGKCGSLDDARNVFVKLSERDIWSWNAMIAACTQNAGSKEALELFGEMQDEGIKPSEVTFVSILSACATLAALEEAYDIHAIIVDCGFEADIVVGTALLNMYGKCGSVDDAWTVFVKLHDRNTVSWNAMIAAYTQNGHGKKALKLFNEMESEGVNPDEITFIHILTACSHAGLVDTGKYYFACIEKVHGLTPSMDHYECMVDLLGRAGQMDEAENFIRDVPSEFLASAWLSLLAVCRIHGDVERGLRAADHVLKLNPENPCAYVLLSNIHAAAGRWVDVANIRKSMKAGGVKKEPGYSYIEIEKKIHEFSAGDMSHPQIEEIHAELLMLSRRMKEEGYKPEQNPVLHNVEEDTTEDMLCYHSEKLALAFGLISTPPGALLRITKNLQICSDCHSATKFISKFLQRKIIVRDASCFHRFQHGVCSCGDFW